MKYRIEYLDYKENEIETKEIDTYSDDNAKDWATRLFAESMDADAKIMRLYNQEGKLILEKDERV